MLAQVFSRYAWFHGTQELLRLTSKPAEAIASVLTEMANATTACGNLMAPFDWASRATAATLKQWSFLTGEFGDPGFNLNHTVIDGNKVSVEEEVVIKKPFCDIVHFKRDCAGRNDPKLLIFAPMAGHYASLLKGTIKSFLPDHDVYITGWKNAAHVSVDEGEAFGLDDYFAYAKDFITKLGPNVHALAVCQATIPVATAVSRIAEDSPENQPASLTLIAGPGDVRRANCPVTDFAEKNSLKDILSLMSDVVPAGLPGEGRRVVPGYMMLSAFTGMNPGNHANSFYKAWLDDIVSDNGSSKTYNFYLDYNAVLDMDARFYEQTVKWVFQEARLARGIMMMEGRPVNPRFITSPQLVVEGGKDEISPPGHTLAYLEMMGGSSKYHILNPSVGHYGAFTGSKFDKQIAPCIKAHIRQAGSGIGLLYNSIPETDTEAMKIWDGKCPPPRENTPGTGSAESPFLFPF